jgi:hypothetical protein
MALVETLRWESSEMTSRIAGNISIVGYRSAELRRRAELPTDLHAACGIGVGVLLGIAMWAAIIAVSIAVTG